MITMGKKKNHDEFKIDIYINDIMNIINQCLTSTDKTLQKQAISTVASTASVSQKNLFLTWQKY